MDQEYEVNSGSNQEARLPNYLRRQGAVGTIAQRQPGAEGLNHGFDQSLCNDLDRLLNAKDPGPPRLEAARVLEQRRFPSLPHPQTAWRSTGASSGGGAEPLFRKPAMASASKVSEGPAPSQTGSFQKMAVDKNS